MSAKLGVAALGQRIAALPARAQLRFALKLDAVVTGANGAAYLAAADALDSAIGIEGATVRGVGVFLLVFAAAVWAAGTASRPGGRAVAAIIAVNVCWAIGSVIVAGVGVGSPTAGGTVWIVMQALTVAGFAGLQYLALARTR